VAKIVAVKQDELAQEVEELSFEELTNSANIGTIHIQK